MPTTTQISFFDSDTTLFAFKVVILLILTFYAIFSLIVVRQVDLMAKTLISRVSAVVKAMAILNLGLAVGLIILAFGIL